MCMQPNTWECVHQAGARVSEVQALARMVYANAVTQPSFSQLRWWLNE